MDYTNETQVERNKRKHITLTIQEKLDIINLIDAGHSRRVIANKYGVGKTTVHDIYKRKDKIHCFALQTQKTSDLTKRRRLGVSLEERTFVKTEEYDYKEIVEEETLVENFDHEGFEYANEQEYEIVYEPALVDTTNDLIQKSTIEITQLKLEKCSPKRKSKTLTLKEKYDVLKLLENGESVPKICQKYEIGRTTVYDFIKSKDKIVEYIELSCDENRKTFKRSNYPEIENQMTNWCRANEQFTKQQFVDKCKQCFVEQKKMNPAQFCGNWSWCKRFFERYPEFKRKMMSVKDEFLDPSSSSSIKNEPFKEEEIDTCVMNSPMILKRIEQLSHAKSTKLSKKNPKYYELKKSECNESEIIFEELESGNNNLQAESLEFIDSEFLPMENENEESQQNEDDDEEYIIEELEHENPNELEYEDVQNEEYETTTTDSDEISDEEALRNLKVLIKYSARKGHSDVLNLLIEYKNILEEELA